MDNRLYLVAYLGQTLHDDGPRIKSISLTGKQVGHMFRRLRDMSYVIMKQTGDVQADIFAITALHKLEEDAGSIGPSIPSSTETTREIH